MCHFFSFLGFKNGDHFHASEFTDSHEELILFRNVHDTESALMHQLFFRGEFTPPDDISTVSDLSTWKLRVDEYTVPEWYNEAKTREWCEAQVSKMFVKGNAGTVFGGCWILDGKDSRIEILRMGRIPIAVNGANLESANLYSANLRLANLESANLYSANLRQANLRQANLESANLYSANLESANLYSANLRLANLESANLYSANLRLANLESANLRLANLRRANLRRANLESANLRQANLRQANLESANLRQANLYSANLRLANLESANLYSANLRRANLRRANLESARNLTLPSGWKKTDDGIVVGAYSE